MKSLGIRSLKQNASAVVAQAAAGEVITITDRGRAVALLVPLPRDALAALVASGRVREPKSSLATLGPPPRRKKGEPSLSAVLREMREDERY